MAPYQAGPRAYRVNKRYERAGLTAPLFDPVLLKLDFAAAGLSITGMMLRQIGADMDMDKIDVYIDPDLPAEGMTDMKDGRIRVWFDSDALTTLGTTTDNSRYSEFTTGNRQLDLSAKALIVHEGVHASLLKRGLRPTCRTINDEAAAYIAQALVFRLNGKSIYEDWREDNTWFDAQPQNKGTDPAEANAKAGIYRKADELVVKFALDQRRASLTSGDIAELIKALEKDDDYKRCPVPPSNNPAKKARRKTLRERVRERRLRRQQKRQ